MLRASVPHYGFPTALAKRGRLRSAGKLQQSEVSKMPRASKNGVSVSIKEST
jgi:hypothetical protein